MPPVSFSQLGSSILDDVTVSRISAPRPRLAGEPKFVPRRTGADMKFGPTPLEHTLQQRQALMPSYSEPSLSSTQAVALPRLTKPRSRAGPGFNLAATAPVDAQGIQGSVGDDNETGDAWLGLLSGGRRVDIPFDRFGADPSDNETFVHWYHTTRNEALHVHNTNILLAQEMDGSELPPPTLPWKRAREEAQLWLSKVEPQSGRASQLRTRIQLYKRLEASSTPRGLRALSEALDFWLGSVAEARRVLNFSGSGELSFLELVGCIALLDLDVEMMCGVDAYTLFTYLDVEQKDVITIERLTDPGQSLAALRRECLARGLPSAPDPAIQQAKNKWILLSRWMAAAELRHAALRSERVRRGWRKTTTAAGESESQGAKNNSGGAVEDSTGAPKAAPAEVVLETAQVLRELDRPLRALFLRAASVKLQDGSHMMSRSDVQAFFSDMEHADRHRQKAATQEVINVHFDEAIKVQLENTKLGQNLFFSSFKVFLSNIPSHLGLGWGSLVGRLAGLDT
jgi:hypothetical protein